ncbi:phytoene/squalene synthetase [Anaerolinea thermolimosa]|nr:squalene/phytoene synthase family protein [Anaerolinea thermolimosa]GAP07332.1 phytoene/squalene synthetase [Anaerolinea thermolimosa]
MPFTSGSQSIRTSPRLQAALTATEEVIRKHSRTFFFATSLLPFPERLAIRSLYAFCRASDDLVDCANTTPADLEAWRARVNLPSEQQTDPILLSWALVREQYPIDRQYEGELLDGIAMDLSFRPYPTWETLQHYCYRVAATVGLLSIPVIGLAPGVTFEQAAPYAIRLGIALQLTNILRDVGEDADRGRVYFPLEDLARFHLSMKDILNHVYDERFIALMQFEIRRTRQLFEESLPGITLLSRVARPAVGAASLLYRAILDEIEAIHYQVHEKRAHTSAWKKISMLPKILYCVSTLERPSSLHPARFPETAG